MNPAPALPPEARITVVTVAFNSQDVLPAMLEALPPGVAVVVVDNASRGVEPLRQVAVARGVRWVDNPSNEGFGRACNRGAREATTEFLLFLNPDARVRPDTLAELVAAADRHPGASAFNPRLEGPDGVPFFKRKSDLLPRRRWMPRGSPATEQAVSVLSGAALFVRRAAFERVGGFDPALFLFYEDDDLALRLAAQCGPLMHVPGAVVQHVGGGSSGTGADILALKAWHMGWSLVHTARKHGRRRVLPWALASSALKLALPWTWARRHKHLKHRAFLRGAITAWTGGAATERIPT